MLLLQVKQDLSGCSSLEKTELTSGGTIEDVVADARQHIRMQEPSTDAERSTLVIVAGALYEQLDIEAVASLISIKVLHGPCA